MVRGVEQMIRKLSLAEKVTAEMLDHAAPDHPVYLPDDTDHLGWLNSAALKATKIDEDTPDPPGGTINRDDGGPTTSAIHDAAAA